MTPLQIIFVAVLVVVQTLAAYISRIYSEFGKILSREVQENLDAWETRIEPHLGLAASTPHCARRFWCSFRWAHRSRVRRHPLWPRRATRRA